MEFENYERYKKWESKENQQITRMHFSIYLQAVVVMQNEMILNLKSVSLAVTNNNDPKGE